MTAVVLQPAGDAASLKHFVDTIESPVPLSRMVPFLPENDRQLLSSLYSSRPIPTWGVTPGKIGQNATKWHRLEPGDVTLFTRDGRIVSSGVMTHKLRSESLAEHLWSRKEDGSTWEYIYFLDEITAHDIPVKEMNRLAGYKPNNVVQSFNVLDEQKSTAILEYFNLDSRIHFPTVTEEQFFNTLDAEQSLDKPSTTTQRKEQSFLRNTLFGKKTTGQCCICGKTYPVEFLVTAHIKKRADCTLEERKDYRNIVAPMCKFGCDDLYERHYMYIENGTIRENPKRPGTSDLHAYMESLDGSQCLVWGPGNRHYFEWHRRQATGSKVR